MNLPLLNNPPIVPKTEELETGFADFQNDALVSREARKDGSHEEAAHEKRNWVRLSYDCNNHCTFCLDSDAHNGTMRGTMDIKVQIVEGKKRGAERLILSGGEPTMHPNFLDFVKLGSKAGYRKVQTVTNGRMFKYPEFLNKAADNGLNEITFSLHGHNAKLHDALVGTPGAYVEETAGLKAALASGRFIVNVDIVINKQNVRHLPEMLETFIGWGVLEFDLLHVIPFGNAWSLAKDHLFYDLDGNLEYLQKAFAYARRPDVHIWLNRFPPPYAEGFEDLIQDPYKLNDEVRGRREEYDRYLAFGQKLHCREPERCHRCYLQPLCDGLDETLSARKAGLASQSPNVAPNVDSLEESGRSQPAQSPIASVDVLRMARVFPSNVAFPGASTILVVAPDLTEAIPIANSAKFSQTEGRTPALALELADYSGLEKALSDNGLLCGMPLVRCIVSNAETAASLLAMNATFEVAIVLSKKVEAFVQSLSPAPARLSLIQPNYDRVTDALANDVDAAAFFERYQEPVKVVNLPACLAGEKRAQKHLRVLDTEALGPDGRVNMKAFTQRFIEDGFYTKALRCKDCSVNAECRGVHVNWVRAHSFAALTPLRA